MKLRLHASGQGLTEYAIMGALVAVVSIAAIQNLSGGVTNALGGAFTGMSHVAVAQGGPETPPPVNDPGLTQDISHHTDELHTVEGDTDRTITLTDRVTDRIITAPIGSPTAPETVAPSAEGSCDVGVPDPITGACPRGS